MGKRRVKVTVTIEVESDSHLTDEVIGRVVESHCLDILQSAGFDPISCGYEVPHVCGFSAALP